MNINSAKVLYNVTGTDEAYTPYYAVKPILKYIPCDAVVWCPFDKEESEFVKQISKTNKVIYSHIDNGEDFLDYEPSEHWDIIISNPPFKNKRLFFERALSFNKPFALLMTNTAFNDKYPIWCFEEAGRQFQCLKFDRRIHFSKPDGTVMKKTTFGSSYFCSDFFHRDFIQEAINY